MLKTFHLETPFSVIEKGMEEGCEGIKIAGYANTSEQDRGGDIILSSAWNKGLDNYRKNPVLLLQHKHDQAIGRVDNIRIDQKGLYVEAFVSSAAEKKYGLITLIKDNVLKSFSVGIIPKKMKQPGDSSSNIITELELLEVSVVAVPMNQDSLFSIKKGFETTEEYETYIKTLQANTIVAEKSTTENGHYHILELDENKDGVTVYSSHGETHFHTIKNGEIQETNGHTHALDVKAVSTEVVADTDEEVIPEFVPTFVNSKSIKNGTFVRLANKRYKTIKIATPESPTFKFLEVDLNGKSNDNSVINVEANDLTVINNWDAGTNYDLLIKQIPSIELTEDVKSQIEKEYEEFVTLSEIKTYALKTTNKDNLTQEKINKLLNLKSTPKNEWSASEYNYAAYLVTVIKELFNLEDSNDRNLEFALHGYDYEIKKEKSQMSTQQAGEVLTVPKSVETPNTVSVAEPRVAELIAATGEAMLKEADAQDKQGFAEGNTTYTPVETEAVTALKAEVKKYQDQIASLSASKMLFQENTRNAQRFTPKEMADALLLAKALNRADPFSTKLGAKMKAVTTVDQFLSNFSTTVYEEMEQQLVVAPMFKRLSVDARNFRIPVSDEDTNGDVAQFQSGTFAQSVSDSTRVPTTRQNTISAVELTPHKFMATTHLAKDEQEDTILPLLDFLRQAATRRMARAIDKGLLRGDGALTGFNASPTNAITVGTGYACVFKGIVTLANDIAGLQLDVGSGAKADPADIALARAKLGKYGLQLGSDLVYLTSVEGYNSLITFSEFRTVDKFGPNATLLTGAVGAIYGIPVVVTEFLDVAGVSTNQIGLLVYKPGFIVGERRAMEVESEYEPRQQVTALYMSTRFDMKALTTNSGSALDATKYSYASVLRSA